MTEFVDREKDRKYKGDRVCRQRGGWKYKGDRVCRQRGGWEV